MPDDRGLDFPVESDRGDGVLDAGDHQKFELHVVADVADRPQAFRQAFGGVDRGVVGEQHGVELLLLGAGHQFLVGQRRRGVEQRCAVAVFGEQSYGQRYLFGQAHRGELVQISAVGREVLRARVDPVALVGAEPVQQTPHPGGFVRGVHPGAVDDGQLVARVIEQVPGVNARVRRVRHRRQRGNTQPSRASAVSVHLASVSLRQPRCGRLVSCTRIATPVTTGWFRPRRLVVGFSAAGDRNPAPRRRDLGGVGQRSHNGLGQGHDRRHHRQQRAERGGGRTNRVDAAGQDQTLDGVVQPRADTERIDRQCRRDCGLTVGRAQHGPQDDRRGQDARDKGAQLQPGHDSPASRTA